MQILVFQFGIFAKRRKNKHYLYLHMCRIYIFKFFTFYIQILNQTAYGTLAWNLTLIDVSIK